MARIARHLQRDVAWRGLEAFPSLELCRLRRSSRSPPELAGAVAHEDLSGKTLVSYRVESDLRGSTALVRVDVLTPTGIASIGMEFDEEVDRFVGFLRGLSNRDALRQAGIRSEDFWLKV